MKEPVYIIFSWGYSEETGGILALHKLCDAMRKAGKQAYIWPAHEPVSGRWPVLSWYWRQWRMRIKKSPRYAFPVNPSYDTPLASIWKLKNAIVIYPEVVPGNPLRAKHIVRWFLNKPGRLTGQTHYGPNELYFYYQEAFNEPTINPDPDNKLLIITIMDDIYKQTNFGPRTGTCYILRKGKDRAPPPESLGGVVIDGRSHAEIAAIFNQSEYCVSYDSYTMFSAYAAMCGCKSIVVPTPGVDRATWQPIEKLTYGIAYGESDVERATQTRDKMIANYASMEAENLKSVDTFTQKCRAFFSV